MKQVQLPNSVGFGVAKLQKTIGMCKGDDFLTLFTMRSHQVTIHESYVFPTILSRHKTLASFAPFVHRDAW